jgi:hypothetical protein
MAVKSKSTKSAPSALRVKNFEDVCEYYGDGFTNGKSFDEIMVQPKLILRFLVATYDGDHSWLSFSATEKGALKELVDEMNAENFRFAPWTPDAIHDLDSDDPFQDSELSYTATVQRKK